MTPSSEPAATPGAVEPSLRIVLAIGSMHVGGAERQLAGLAGALVAAGHEVHVLALKLGGPLEEELRRAGVPLTVIGLRRIALWRRGHTPGSIGPLGAMVRVVRFLRAYRPDVCHAWLWWAYTIVLPLAWAVRVPARLIGLRSLVQPAERNAVKRLLALPAVRAAGGCTANSQAVLDDHREVRRVAVRRVIGNAVTLPEDLADPASEPPVAVCVANLIRYKGHDVLLDAVAAMAHPLAVRLVGHGAEEAALRAQAGELGITDRVTFDGLVPDPGVVVRHAQLAVLLSRTEGMPNAVLEAMALGLPVVATRVGGVPDLVRHEETGVLVPVDDAAAAAAALDRLAADPELRARMGAAGREAAAARSWPHCRDAYVALYREVLDRTGRYRGR